MTSFVRTQEIEHEIGGAGTFSLRVTSSDVELRAVEGPLARARVRFEIQAASAEQADEMLGRLRFEVNEGPGLLELVEPRNRGSGIDTVARLFGLRRDDVELSVEAELPRGATLRYEGVSADVTASGLEGSQEYRTVSGDLVLDRVSGELRARGVSSDISLRTDEHLTSLELTTVSGDVTAFVPAIAELRVATVSGDVELETRLGSGVHHRVETVSGDLSLGVADDLTLEVRGLSTDVNVALPHHSEGARDRRRYVIGDGTAHLLFSSMSGDVSVGHARRLGPLPLAPPSAPSPPPPPELPAPPAAPAPDAGQLDILRALERGEIDVDEAARRLGRA